MQGKAITTPPPPPCLHVPGSGTPRERGRGRGRCWSSPDSYAPPGVSHGSDPSDMTICLSQLMDHPSLQGNTPASAPQSEIVFSQQQRSWGLRGEGEPEGGGVGEVRGGGKHICGRLFGFASSLRKNYDSVALESCKHIFSGRLQLLLHSWSVALSRIDSRWKKCTLAQQVYSIFRAQKPNLSGDPVSFSNEKKPAFESP
jgi:hypothetical protein